MLTYSNPRTYAEIQDWPSGRHRTTAIFRVEHSPTKGERVTRTTFAPTGRPNAPKALTYARKSRIVDGDDGRTYVINLTEYGHISVMCSDMQHSLEAIFEGDPRYGAVVALFDPVTA